MWLYVLVAVLLLVAIAVQVLYVRQYAAQATGCDEDDHVREHRAACWRCSIGLLAMAYRQLGG